MPFPRRCYKLFDRGGLYVLATPSGSRLWRLKYRHSGREKGLSFGPYPPVTLKHARRKRGQARLLLLEDCDLGEERKQARLEAESERAITFGDVAEKYLTNTNSLSHCPVVAQFRVAIDLIRPVSVVRRFQASQQASTMSSQFSNTRLER